MPSKERKYFVVYETLKREILSGKFRAHSAFPSKAMIVRRFGIANLTAVRVLELLKQEGLVVAQQGRGTFVAKRVLSRKIGLLVPGVAYTEFFPPVVDEISRIAQRQNYSLLLGNLCSLDIDVLASQSKNLAHQLVNEKVDGVIFQPVEKLSTADEVNREILSIFKQANIPVVLTDYDVSPSPVRSEYDVVGINNFDAGYRVAAHLIEVGARHICFLMRSDRAPSHQNRLRGVVAAVEMIGRGRCRWSVMDADSDDVNVFRRVWRRKDRPDAFVCGNDDEAATFKRMIERIGLCVPDDVLLAGFNDVRFASVLTPPLTTIHQPCREIGATVFRMLLERIEHPELPPREVYLPAPLVIRASTCQKPISGETK